MTADDTRRTRPIPVIVETDIFSDVDDVGALALVHAFADRGRAELLSVGVNTRSRYGHQAVRVINAFFGRPVPVGTLLPTDDSVFEHDYARQLTRSYPELLDDSVAPSAVTVHRAALAGADEQSVVIISLGFFDNLRELLDSGPDEFSPLSGRELITSKVARTVIMGGWFPRGWEFNVGDNAPLAAGVIAVWPTMIEFLGFEVGEPVITGASITTDGAENVIGAAYRAYDPGRLGRESWDPLTVLFALGPDSGLFRLSPPGRVQLDPDGVSTFTESPDGRHRYVIAEVEPSVLASAVDELLEDTTRRR